MVTDIECHMENNDQEGWAEQFNDNINIGYHVKIISQPYVGLYAVVINESYGDEMEIQYFEEKYGKWVLKDGDLDSREPSEMMKVDAEVDGRRQYTFSK